MIGDAQRGPRDAKDYRIQLHPPYLPRGVATSRRPAHHGRVSQPTPEYDDAYETYEAWRDLQDVLEERDAEWWAGQDTDDEER